jgi:hypothetical protein
MREKLVVQRRDMGGDDAAAQARVLSSAASESS